MKIETLRTVLPLVVGLLIPLFYLGVYLSSACQRLRLLQERVVRGDAVLGANLEDHLRMVQARLDASNVQPVASELAAAVRRALAAVRRWPEEQGGAEKSLEDAALALTLAELQHALEAWSAKAGEEAQRALEGTLRAGQALIELAKEHQQVVDQHRAFRRAPAGRLAAAFVRTPRREQS